MEWPSAVSMFSMAVKELILVVIAAALYGHQSLWQGHVVQFVSGPGSPTTAD